MNTFLLILGLTVIYYVVLFYFDNKRKKAFRLAKKNAIGKTAELPIIEEGGLFGSTGALDNPIEVEQPKTIVQKAIAAKNVVHQYTTQNVTEDLNELAVHLDGGQTIELPKENLIDSLQKASNEELIGEEEISAFIQSPKLKGD